MKEAKRIKEQKSYWKLDDGKSKLKQHHKAFLAGLHKCEETRNWTLEQKRVALLGFYPDIGKVS